MAFLYRLVGAKGVIMEKELLGGLVFLGIPFLGMVFMAFWIRELCKDNPNKNRFGF